MSATAVALNVAVWLRPGGDKIYVWGSLSAGMQDEEDHVRRGSDSLTSAKVSASVNSASAMPFLSWSDSLLIGS